MVEQQISTKVYEILPFAAPLGPIRVARMTRCLRANQGHGPGCATSHVEGRADNLEVLTHALCGGMGSRRGTSGFIEQPLGTLFRRHRPNLMALNGLFYPLTVARGVFHSGSEDQHLALGTTPPIGKP